MSFSGKPRFEIENYSSPGCGPEFPGRSCLPSVKVCKTGQFLFASRLSLPNRRKREHRNSLLLSRGLSFARPSLILQFRLRQAIHSTMNSTGRQKRTIDDAPATPAFFAHRPVGNDDVCVSVVNGTKYFLWVCLCCFRMRVGQFRIEHNHLRPGAWPAHIFPPCGRARQGLRSRKVGPRSSRKFAVSGYKLRREKSGSSSF